MPHVLEIVLRHAGATAKQLQLVTQALTMSQAAKALAVQLSSQYARGSSSAASNGAAIAEVPFPCDFCALVISVSLVD